MKNTKSFLLVSRLERKDFCAVHTLGTFENTSLKATLLGYLTEAKCVQKFFFLQIIKSLSSAFDFDQILNKLLCNLQIIMFIKWSELPKPETGNKTHLFS